MAEAARGANQSAILPTAADAFAGAHDLGLLDDQSGWYRARMPVSLPASGQQFAFAVELDACTGCKACVVACHSLNGLDDDELWRSVGVLHGTPAGSPLGLGSLAVAEQRTVTAACHHCVDPACLNGCPVDAYEKDLITGAVVHLDDQCIGCSYCTMTCPYEVPKFNDRLGIVRKCDMCRGRLVAGQEPACVQGCPNGAIHIITIDQQLVIAEARYGATPTSLVPGASLSSLSVPSTVYRTALPTLVGLEAEDASRLLPSVRHDPLAAMLVLTQAAVGASMVDAALRVAGADPGRSLAAVVPMIAGLGMAISLAHLGRPSKAWRVVIGIGHSWLSREAVALGAFLGLASMNAVFPHSHLAAPAATIGMASVSTSVKVYAVTGRAWWSLRRTTQRFANTAAALGLAIAAVCTASALRPLALGAAMAALVGSLCGRASAVDPDASVRRTAALLAGPLRGNRRLVVGLALIAVTMLVIAAAAGSRGAAGLGTLFFIISALMERSLFFRAVAPSRMPGCR